MEGRPGAPHAGQGPRPAPPEGRLPCPGSPTAGERGERTGRVAREVALVCAGQESGPASAGFVEPRNTGWGTRLRHPSRREDEDQLPPRCYIPALAFPPGCASQAERGVGARGTESHHPASFVGSSRRPVEHPPPRSRGPTRAARLAPNPLQPGPRELTNLIIRLSTH